MTRHLLIGLMALTAFASGAQADFVVGPKCERMFAETGVPEMEGDTAHGGDGYFSLCRKGYAAYLNTATKNPDWVAEEVTARSIKGKAARKDNFTEDKDAPGSATLNDYRGSGFDRGHQAPADFKRNQKLMDESFFLTNMAPQIGQYRGIWAQLEDDVRDLARTRKRLIVFTGPVYDGPVKTIGDLKKTKPGANVAVPDSFYKVVYHPATHRAVAFLIPNKKLCKRDPSDFITDIRHIEELSGVDFFPNLSRRQRNLLEKNQGNLWGW